MSGFCFSATGKMNGAEKFRADLMTLQIGTAIWEPAQTLRDVRRLVKPGPLSGPELAAFWEDTDAARDKETSLRGALRRIIEESNVDLRLLVYGHGGAGKSTELIKLEEELNGAFFTVRFSVRDHFNIAQIVAEDVPVVIAERVLDAAVEAKLPLSAEKLEPIYQWFTKTTITEKTATDAEMKAAAEAKLGSPVEFLKLLFSFKSEIKVSSGIGSEKIRDLRTNRSELLNKVNQFLTEVHFALPVGKRLLIIVEDMDKLEIAKANELFIKNSSLLAGVDATIIYTIPIFTFHSPEAGAMKAAFDNNAFALTMIKIAEADTNERAPGFEVVRKIVRRRIPEVLLPDDALELAIEKTGGVLRHLFEVIHTAANMTNFKSETDPITVDRIRYGLNKKMLDFNREIAVPYGVANYPDLTVGQLYDRLAEHHRNRSSTYKPGTDAINQILLKYGALIEYNGTGWCGVHPLVVDLLVQQGRMVDASNAPRTTSTPFAFRRFSTSGAPVYLSDLSINNFRCFESINLNFVVPTHSPDAEEKAQTSSPKITNVTLLLGDNGTGKTSVLRAAALCLVGPILDGSGFRSYFNISRQNETDDSFKPTSLIQGQGLGYLSHATDGNSVVTTERSAALSNIDFKVEISLLGDDERLSARIAEIPRTEEAESVSSTNITPTAIGISSDFLVLGYGATRRVEAEERFDPAREKSRDARYQRIASLFEDHFSLVPLTSWLPLYEARNSARAEEVWMLISSLLPTGVTFENRWENIKSPASENYLFRFQDAEIPFAALSDGYRAFIGWVGDMMFHMCEICPEDKKLTELQGVVMVDEVDLHLHPSWQRYVVDKLSSTFPCLQFIFTSHSPLVTGTLEPKNIWKMEKTDSGVVPQRYVENVFGLSADQILTSSYFDLDSPRAPSAEVHLRELAQRTVAGDSEAGLRFLEALTGGIVPLDDEDQMTNTGEDISDGEG